MALASRYYGLAVAGQPIKNDSSTLLNAGNVNPSLANNITLAENTPTHPTYGSRITVSVSPTSSGNTGIGKAISNGTVNVNTEGNYIAIMLGTKIAGITSTVMRAGYATPGSTINRYQGYRRYGVNSWDYNHVITKGGGAGAAVAPSGINGVTGIYADESNQLPGELTMMTGDSDPTNYNYAG